MTYLITKDVQTFFDTRFAQNLTKLYIQCGLYYDYSVYYKLFMVEKSYSACRSISNRETFLVK